ncbi:MULTISPECIES: peptide chain release factor N(5)-glutamine methyltransferase [Pigmentiphaga]|uniref:Release factor glutamine methyltransferase n=1 Tax=Pigmentiphaga daeguensis TaxID=414049 RepID=A0ABN1C562_9BURK|nr:MULTISPECIES: peptide chain release factor N(5)-glutamine methyltransferase [unclassified Pigmentiphaga]OVZ63471.1 protein-(glutamine-N5) methyltransferase, release factor-specific [Pigmentiphaga sp. NML030171]
MATARELIAGSGLPLLEARMLLERALGVGRAWLIAHDDEALPDDRAAVFRDWARRRGNGEPMAYLLGEREFMGHDFQVSPAVLIPRPETELLVETALEHLRGRATPRVLDLGTGSGAIAVSIALARPDAAVQATDLSAEALAVAAANASRLGAAVTFARGDWYGALNGAAPAPTYDVIVSNPPYIAAADPHLSQGDLRHEPPLALTDRADGLEALRAIVRGAPAWLRPGGALWMEHGWDQAARVRDLLHAAGFAHVESRRDLAGIERISGGYL